MNSFEDLEVWKSARSFRNKVLALSATFPLEEKKRLTDQIIRSSRSITGNVAEGFGRFHHQENIQFCRTARGSLSEILDHLIWALDCNYLDPDSFVLSRSVPQIIQRLYCLPQTSPTSSITY